MKIRLLSDVHLEFDNTPMEFCDALYNPNWNGADVLVLAGDITTKSRVQWIVEMSKHFPHVVYVYGNHEFYKSNFDSVKRHTVESLPSNVHVLDDSSVMLDGVNFHGCTLWSDFNKGDPLTYHAAQSSMNDYRQIRDEKYSIIKPQGIHTRHNVSKMFLADNVKEGDVVVTHHAPTYKSIHARFRGDKLSGCYASDLSDLILDTKPALFCHGHVHDSFDYMVGDTRVVCNPRGYKGSELNPNFDEDLTVEI